MKSFDPTETRTIMRQKKICVLLPTYNNAGSLRDVLERVFPFCDDVIVVNDGCTDQTSQILDSFGDRITVVDYGKNHGKGYALKQGFRKALEQGFDYAITLDTDGQHYPEDIPLFVEALETHPDALIVGSRNLQQENMPKDSAFANRFSNFWVRVQTGVKLPDTQTGYRLYPLQKLPKLSLVTSRYEAELELLVLSAWKRVELIPIDINVFYPEMKDRVTHFKPWRDITRISLLNTVLCIMAFRFMWPIRWIKMIGGKKK